MQFIKKSFISWLLIIIYICILFIVLSINDLATQEKKKLEKPFTCEEIIKLLESKMDQDRIIEQIKRIRVNCDLNPKMVRKLVLAGASEALLDVIEKYPFKDLSIIIINDPKPGEEVGRIVKIEGKSKAVKDKFLWVFAHLKENILWYPQGGTVDIKEDETWQKQRVILGRVQNDIGFDFEIIAIWVDKRTNTEIKNHITEGIKKIGEVPGMPLPEGSPSALVTVKRVR